MAWISIQVEEDCSDCDGKGRRFIGTYTEEQCHNCSGAGKVEKWGIADDGKEDNSTPSNCQSCGKNEPDYFEPADKYYCSQCQTDWKRMHDPDYY